MEDDKMKFTTVRQLVEHAAAFGEKIAFVEMSKEGKTIPHTYANLKTDVDALLTALNARGLNGKHIGVWGVNTYGWVVAYLAVLCGTGVVVPLPADAPRADMEKMLRTAEIEAVLADDMLCPAIKDAVTTYSFTECAAMIAEGRERMAGGDTSALDNAPSADHFCKIIFTSGTTGERRGVMLTQGNIMCIPSSHFIPLIGRVTISVLPPSHAFENVCHILPPLVMGSTEFLCPSLRAFPPMVASSGVDSLFLVPALAEALLTRFTPFLDKATNLKHIICGGAPVPKSLVERYAARGITLHAGYGLSECSPLVSVDARGVIGSVGEVGEYCRVRISAEGEVQVRGENVMQGYYKNEKATREAFTADGWLKTGDLGCLDAEGNLYITGRIKNLIILPNGENVSPEEMETMLVNCVAGVQDALCYTDGRLLGAQLFMGGDDSEATLETVRQAVAKINATLPAYKRIQKVTLTAEPIPMSATGKKKR